jgi:hypothetical protein
MKPLFMRSQHRNSNSGLPEYEADVVIIDREVCWHVDTHTNYMSVFSISANTRSKACVSLLGCVTLDLYPDIDYVDPRHKCMLRATHLDMRNNGFSSSFFYDAS